MMSDRDVSLPGSVCFQLAITPVLVQTCIPFYKQPLIANDFRRAAYQPAGEYYGQLFCHHGLRRED